MANGGAGAAPNGQENLLDELQGILKKQIELIRKSDFIACEMLAGKAETVVERLKAAKLPNRAELRGQFENTAKLYREVILIVATEKERLGRQLEHVGQGRKTLKAYQGRS